MDVSGVLVCGSKYSGTVKIPEGKYCVRRHAGNCFKRLVTSQAPPAMLCQTPAPATFQTELCRCCTTPPHGCRKDGLSWCSSPTWRPGPLRL